MRWNPGVLAIAGAILAGCASDSGSAPQGNAQADEPRRQWLVEVRLTDADDLVIASPSIVVTEGAQAAVSVVEETPIVRDCDLVERDGRVAAVPVPGVVAPGLAFETVVRGIDGRPRSAAVAFDVSWTWIEDPIPLRLVPGGDPAGPGVEIHMPSVGRTSARGARAMQSGSERTLARLADETGAPLFVSVRINEIEGDGEPRSLVSVTRLTTPRPGIVASREDPLGHGSDARVAADAPASGRGVGNGGDSSTAPDDALTRLADAAALDSQASVVSLAGSIDAEARVVRPLPCAGAPMTGRSERAGFPNRVPPREWAVEADTVEAPGVRLARTVTFAWLADVVLRAGLHDPVLATAAIGGEAEWTKDDGVTVRDMDVTAPVFRPARGTVHPFAVESRTSLMTEQTRFPGDDATPETSRDEWNRLVQALERAEAVEAGAADEGDVWECVTDEYERFIQALARAEGVRAGAASRMVPVRGLTVRSSPRATILSVAGQGPALRSTVRPRRSEAPRAAGRRPAAGDPVRPLVDDAPLTPR